MTAAELFGDKTRLGTFLFLGSESVFFIFLIVAYIYYHGDVIGGPTARNSLHPVTMGIYTIILLSSSASVYMAERAFRKRSKAFLYWIAVTIIGGAVFLYGELAGYLALLKHDVTISHNVFGSTYFTLTGFHALHVTVGLILLLILLALGMRDRLRVRHGVAVQSISYYWHFVDIVWAAVFTVIYLWSMR